MIRSLTIALLIALPGIAQASSLNVCKPSLSIKDAQFSQWQLPTMERKWSAVVSVDASRCAENSAGNFEIGFLRLIENGVDMEFSEGFIWSSSSLKIGLDFWANEAIGHYWIHKVGACPCREGGPTH
jgi:hypothetical protein